MKELAYLHCEGILTGELNLGALAQVNELMSIVMIVMRDGFYEKTSNAMQQVKTCGIQPIVICEKGNKDLDQFTSKIFEVPNKIDCLQVGFVKFCLLMSNN